MKDTRHLSKTFCVVGAVLLFCAAASAQVEKPLRRVDPKVFAKPVEQSTPPADAKPAQKPPITPKPTQEPIIPRPTTSRENMAKQMQRRLGRNTMEEGIRAALQL